MTKRLIANPDSAHQTNGHSERGDFFKTKPSQLILADGSRYDGLSPVWQNGAYPGEVVFNTGMTGYVESLTDPSYAGQILVFTFPLIGNYGSLDETAWESNKIHVAGVVVSQVSHHWSHSSSHNSLLDWLEQQNVPIITDVDTRLLTKHLRSRGTMMGAISQGNSTPSGLIPQLAHVSIAKPLIYNEQQVKTIIAVDCGMKSNILRSLIQAPLRIKQVPFDYDYTQEDFDGVVLSNGPGDPTDYPETIAIARQAMSAAKPMFGICLGTQIMALAAGAKTFKLPYGHRGHNQPCISEDGKCYITSQNHGYAINEATLPRSWRVSFRNLNDNSIEGISHATKPFFSVQFHPEATPGPTDTSWLFNKFFQSL